MRVDGLHHVHVEGDYDVLLERESTDFAEDARDFLHDMADDVGNSEGEEFSAEVRAMLLGLVVEATGGLDRRVGMHGSVT
ncbi:hypothetical protein PG993_011427 [Apiospora rasikravindrae]|uniref:Uncharacterized protein n=1 Tax=Apiospora rasikravindrae TaxID=990691 RepID=A0ABR1SEJ6_9PEZI